MYSEQEMFNMNRDDYGGFGGFGSSLFGGPQVRVIPAGKPRARPLPPKIDID